MLVINGKTKERFPYAAFRNTCIEYEINTLDRLIFEIPKQYRNVFDVEHLVEFKKGDVCQEFIVKNIEPFYDGYKIEGFANNSDWQEKFNKSLNFPYKGIKDVLDVITPAGWKYVVLDDIKTKRTITGDHKTSWEIFEELIKKYEVEYKLDAYQKTVIIGRELSQNKDIYLTASLNLEKQDISVENFEFATKIIPEGMNGLKINQINNGLDYLEDKSFSDKTITYYWKDERYTNIKNLKDEAARKLKVLSKPKTVIELKAKDLKEAIDQYDQDFKTNDLRFGIGDYVYLIDKDRKTKEKFRILKLLNYPFKTMDNEITLSNKPQTIIDDLDEAIDLTNQMWEETRVRFETTEDSIEASVATSRRYTDDSFKTYKTERKQTDSQIYESITEATTYVDPVTGQTKPIIDKQLEIDKTIDGINISVKNQIRDVKGLIGKLDEKYPSIADLHQASDDLNKKILSVESDFKIKNDEISSTITSISTSTNNKIKSLQDDLNSGVPLGTKQFIEKNYATISQTNDSIVSSVGKVKAEVDSEFKEVRGLISQTNSTIAQTNDMIKTEVSKQIPDISGVEDKADRAIRAAAVAQGEVAGKVTYTDFNSYKKQTAEMIESKVSAGEAYSLIRQEVKNIKISADQIDLTGNVSVVGDFKTSSYGKRVHIEGSEIKFYDDYGSFIGKMGIDRDGALNLNGAYDQEGSISINSPWTIDYTNFSNQTVKSYLYGDWGATNFYSFSLSTRYIFVDRDLTVYNDQEVGGDLTVRKKINLGYSAYIKLNPAGTQLWIGRTYDSYDFVIDFNEKKTFWA